MKRAKMLCRISLVLMLAFASFSAFATATPAGLLPNGKQQFIDSNGAPLVGGRVYFYIPQSTTFKSTWQDAGKTVLNTNPVILDSNGQAVIYGSGSYRQVVKDALSNTIWDQLTQDAYAVLPNPSGKALYLLRANAAGDGYELFNNTNVGLGTVADMASLRALSPAAYAYVYMDHYTTAGDGGTSNFYWSAGSTAADDGGFVIVPNSAPAAGRWLRNEHNVITPIMFGLGAGSGSGVDSTPVYNKMLAASATYNIQNLKFLSGSYYFNTQPNCITSGMTVSGDGLVNTVLRKNFNDGFLLCVNTYGGNTIGDMALDAEATVSGGIMFYAYAVDSSHAPNGLILQNLYISPFGTDNYRYGIFIDGQNRTTGAIGIRDVKMINVDVFGGAVSAVFLGSIQGLSWYGGGTYAAGGTGTESIVISGTNTVTSNLLEIDVTSLGGDISLDHANDVSIKATTIAGSILTASTDNHCVIQGRISGTVDPTWKTSFVFPLTLLGAATYNPPNLADGTGTTTTVTVTGAALGDVPTGNFSLSTQGIIMSAAVTSADTVTVSLFNKTGGAIDLASGTLTVRSDHYY